MPTYQFGSYTYATKCYIIEHPEAPAAKLRTADPANHPGLYSGGGLRAALRQQVTGVLVAGSGDDLTELWRALVIAHEPGSPQALYLEDSTRYLLAEVESGPIEMIQSPPLMGAKAFEIGFLIADPYWYAASETTQALAYTNGGTDNTSVDPAGGAYSLPTITLEVATADGVGTITINNILTGEVLVLTPANGATGTYVIDCAAKSIVKDGTTAIYAYDGEFPRLDPASQTISITLAAGVTLSDADIAWRDRD